MTGFVCVVGYRMFWWSLRQRRLLCSLARHGTSEAADSRWQLQSVLEHAAQGMCYSSKWMQCFGTNV